MAVRFHQSFLPCLCAALGIGLATQLAGCSRGADVPPTYPVSGRVLHNDKPVEGATVVFRSRDAEKTHLATGVTDAQGRFQLSTFGDKDGAVAGSHTVTVTKMLSDQEEGPSLSMEEAAEQGDPPPAKATNELPARYADPKQTDLTAEVKAEDSNNIDLELMD